MPILTSSETETTAETNDATEEPIEADFKVTQEGHNVLQTCKDKKTKKNRKIPKNQEKRKTISKNKLKQSKITKTIYKINKKTSK